MAMKAWGPIGAWALDAERAEAEEKERAAAVAEGPWLGFAPAANPQSFPSLKEASTTKTKKKKKNTPVSLSEFTTGAYVGPGGYSRRDASSQAVEAKGLTPDELLRLPTGPRERSAEELQCGRGFRSYGYGGGAPRDAASRRTSGGGFDDEARRAPRSAPEFDQPSRADEVDDWAAGKKYSASSIHLDSAPRHDRYSSSMVVGARPSRADEVDNWTAARKPLSFSSATDSDRWVRGSQSSNGERPRLVLAPPKPRIESAPTAEQAHARPSPFGAARPREEVLAEKGVDWKKLDTEIELKKTSSGHMSAISSRPSSAQSSRPGSPGSQAEAVEGAPGPRTRPKVNPFGEAKPREVLLQEKGKDWRKMDMELEHGRVHRLETEEEKSLKEEIEHMKRALAGEADGTLSHRSGEGVVLEEKIIQRERDLEMLVQELDDKVRFGQKATCDIRPGSGAGRSLDWPPSHSGRSEDSRPRSRGSRRDAWVKAVDGGSGLQGGRRFFSNRMERSQSRERW